MDRKLVAALGIDKQLYGQSIFSSSLRLVPEKRKFPKKLRHYHEWDSQ